MIHSKHILAAAFLLAPILGWTQVISGVLSGPDGQPVPGAMVVWQEGGPGCVSDANGAFSFERPDTGHLHIVVIATSYVPDTTCNDGETGLAISLTPIELDAVEIKDTRQGIYIGMDGRKTEVITRTELEKDACCDLAGCFNTQASVEARTTNIITNSKELQVLGLAGVYNQLLIDGLPIFRGLSYTYGISGVPGPIVERIFVAKGAGSVIQGAESVTGQINVIPLDPRKADPLFLNIYGNSFGETQYNAHAALKRRNWSGVVALHSAQPGFFMDQDADSFRDMPALRRYHLMAKAVYRDDDSLGWSGSFNLRLLQETRIGGQDTRTGDLPVAPLKFTQETRFFQPEFWTKFGYKQNEKNKTNVYAAIQHHDQASHFGFTGYDARQLLGNLNAEHSTVWREQQQLKIGLSYRHLDLVENIQFSQPNPVKTFDGQYSTQERIPGAFLENTSFFWKERLTLIAGLRADHHNTFGWFFTPRGLLRFTPGRGFSARASAGTAFRTPLLFSENMQMLSTGRDIILQETLQPERAINLGINVDKTINLKHADGRIGVDGYHTIFLQQFFPDFDQDPGLILVSNFNGRSEGWGLQAETSWEFFQRTSIRVAYNYLEVFRGSGDQRKDLPFIAKHKVMGTWSIWTEGRRLHLDVSAHLYGRQRLPDTQNHPLGYTLPAFSNPYFLMNAQGAAKLDKKGILDLYLGVENITGFRQVRQIAGWESPFNTYFDPTFVWAPGRGREVFMGIRLRPMAGRKSQ